MREGSKARSMGGGSVAGAGGGAFPAPPSPTHTSPPALRSPSAAAPPTKSAALATPLAWLVRWDEALAASHSTTRDGTIELPGTTPLPLSIGENMLGRGDMLGVNDPKISRKQAVITVTRHGAVTFCVVGMNPSWAQRSDGALVRLTKDSPPTTLAHGDAIIFALAVTGPPAPRENCLFVLRTAAGSTGNV